MGTCIPHLCVTLGPGPAGADVEAGKCLCCRHRGGFGVLWGCCAPQCAQLACGAADSTGKGRMRGNDAANFTAGLMVMLLVVASSANPLAGLRVQSGICCSAPWGSSAEGRILPLGLDIQV